MTDPGAPVVNRENPWPGLASFSEDQAAFFHGRTREVEDLFRRVRLNLLTVLHGQSGLGKTSLVQAALFPKLRGIGIVPVGVRVDYSERADSARRQIHHAIRAAVAAAGGTARALGAQESLWEYFHGEAPAITDPAGRPLTVALAFDQFEELFTLGADRGDGQGFVRDLIEELSALSEHRPPSRVEAEFERDPALVDRFDFDRRDYRLLLSLREDFLAHLQDLSDRIPSIAVNSLRLSPLDGIRALEVVERPGAGIVAPGAAQAIVRFVADAGSERHESIERREGGSSGVHSGQPIESLEVDPSLLSLFCRELNERRGGGLITPALVAASREKILADFYERSLADLHPGVRVFVEEDLLTAKGFRHTLPLDSAEEKLAGYGASIDAVTTLVNRRLLHYEQRGPLKLVELTHDVLTRVARESRSERKAKEAVEQSERRAEAARLLAEQEKRETEAKLAQVRRRQRVTRALLGVMVVLAGAAGWALARAAAERSKSQAMLSQFCAYSLSLINRFGDSSMTKPGLNAAYGLLIRLSDSTVETMVGGHGEAACPAQLDTRTEVAAIINLDRENNPKGAIARGYRALKAVRALARFTDTLSVKILVDSYSDLTYRLWRNRASDSAIVSAREGIPFAAQIAPERDPLALDRLARMYHYGVLAILDILSRTESTDTARKALLAEADRMADSGIAIAARGLARPDQDSSRLIISKAQVLFRRGEVDTLLQRYDQGIARYREGVDVLRQNHKARATLDARWWRGVGYSALGAFAMELKRFDDAGAAFDSSLVDWHVYIGRNLELHDTTAAEEGYRGLTPNLLGMARLALARHDPDRAMRLALAAGDSARAGWWLRRSAAARISVSNTLNDVGDVLESVPRRDLADSMFVRRISIDSLAAAQQDHPDDEDVQNVDRSIAKFDRVVHRRATADTAGQPVATQLRILRAAEERSRPLRLHTLSLRRGYAVSAMEHLAPSADTMARHIEVQDSLSDAASNAAWTDLLLGRMGEAMELAQEGWDHRNQYTYILPNYFNALVGTGKDSLATAFFQSHAIDWVEDPRIRFACAAVRDIRTIRWRGAVSDERVQFVERLAAPHLSQCQIPKLPPTQ